MITPSYGPTSGHAPATDRDGRRPRRDADADRDAERFRQLLAPPAPLPEPHRAADDATPPDTPGHRAPGGGILPALPRPTPLPLSAEGLQLRAASGPLAGLMVTAGWHGGRLILRLSAPSGALRDRLAQTGDTLGATLSDLLGIPVTVETAYEPCRPL
ncbi:MULTISPECIES: hypothetical protein [Edwardsiella]|uniref:MFS transporter n=2 Tax=Edwardsiella anguillarum TaxID=1821960 RepID=A0ABY8SGE9_9GAMM|nr:MULTISPECIES: hypothetical protein [Edwardsiella]GAJ67830.1 protein EsaP [Edwardsiella piscicida]AIJ09191.1 putative major facilitator family transporter [Edwardsiella anguillarum ET080813]AKR77116.2 MFS transporter [Edwardsiella sp. LADL05-105]KAB0589961.1 MFS transporter [Edwardsiella anguillarum]RFS99699.1 MFS transporter [Edwardsiella anguillarum]